MKERGILFSGEMVRAILEGRKTQTRRVVKPQPDFFEPGTAWSYAQGHAGAGWYAHSVEYPDEGSEMWRCPYGVLGDRLWVRETWGSPDADHPLVDDGHNPELGDRIVYRANKADDYQWSREDAFVWRPSIYMPRWASRITLEVTGVRVERVQEISGADALAEGCYESSAYYGISPDDAHLSQFQKLWDDLNAKRGFSWDSNPWVWALEFKVLQGGDK